MEKSRLKDRLHKNDAAKALEFIKGHLRYFAAGTLFLVLVLVLVKCTEPGGAAVQPGTEVTSESEETYQVNAYEQVNALIAQYYAAYAAGDTATLQAIATPLSVNEQSYIVQYSQHVEEYQNITCYTKRGLDESSYLVSVTMELKFNGVDTPAPGMELFYVRTNEEGELYIDNLYSRYNSSTQENAQDTSVKSLIARFEQQGDVIMLHDEIQSKYDNAVASDENLATMVQTTIPAAMDAWVSQVVEQNQLAQNTESTETEMPEDVPAEGADAPEETPAEEPETPQVTTETLATNDRVNIRAAADTSSQKLATVDAGTVVTRTAVEGDWSAVEYNGTKGYIKNEYLTYDLPAEGADAPADTDDGGAAVSLAVGTEVTLKDSTNIRSGMSETSDKVGTAYAGEKVTVVMSYAEGWTKVKWKDKTGYIKSTLLQ